MINMIDVIYMQICLCCLGLFSHHIAVLAEMSSVKGKKVKFSEYIKLRPYKMSMSITGSIVGFIALAQMGELTLLTAFGIGMACSDVADRAGRIAIGKLPQ